MFRTEIADLIALQIHHTDEPVLHDQRNSEFGPNLGIGRDVVLVLRDIVKKNRLTGQSNLPDNAFAERKTHRLDLGSVPDLEAHAEIVRAIVQQEDGKNLVVNDGAYQLGGTAQQGLQIEGGVECIRHLYQVGEVRRLHADVERIEMRVRVLRIGRAVVALVL